jgi:predicted dienelactone hydrolase
MFSIRRTLKLFLSLIGIGIILFVIFLGYFLIQRNKTVFLPKPTGQFAVGRIGYDWIDHSRNDVFAKSKGMNRKLNVWMWYPSDLNQNAKKAEYFPGKWETEQVKDQNLSYLEQNFSMIQTHSFKGVPLSTRQITYPLIIFEPGMGDIVLNYQSLAGNLASQGYIVVGINPTYSSRFVVFSDGKVAYRTPKGNIPENNPTDEQLNIVGSKLIKTWADDMTFAINRLAEINVDKGSMWAGHMDMEHIGVFGHSFGGATSVEACLLDNRIKAGIDIDGYLFGVKKGLNKPFMFIMSHHQNNTSDLQELNKIKEVYNGLAKDGYLLDIPKAAHFSFQDNTIFFNPIQKAMGIYGTINGERGLQITNSYLTVFFDKYLRSKNSNLLKEKSSEYAEVKIQVK